MSRWLISPPVLHPGRVGTKRPWVVLGMAPSRHSRWSSQSARESDPVRWWSANITSHSRQPISSLSAWPAPIWSATMQTLDVVDVFLLAGAVVYFGLLLLRRI